MMMKKVFIAMLAITFLYANVSAAEQQSKKFACITGYLNEGLVSGKEITASNNPIDLAFTKQCRQSTCNTDSKASVHYYTNAWKQEFENVIHTIVSSVKDPSIKRAFIKYRNYILGLSDVDLMFVFGGTLNDDTISGGSAASGIVSMVQATFYRTQTLKLIDAHLPKYKYIYADH